MKVRFKEPFNSPAPLLAAQVLVALVPAVCVLWFMTAAMRNERHAVHTRFTEVYTRQLASLQRHATVWAKERQAALQAAASGSAPETFAVIVRDRLADSALVYDRAGRILYPAAGGQAHSDENAHWARARELEFQRRDFAGAAEAYGRIAEESRNPHLQARAGQAQAACWLQAGHRDRAIARLQAIVDSEDLSSAVTEQGNLIVPNVQLRLLQLLHEPGGQASTAAEGDARRAALAPQIRADLLARVNDYTTVDLPANQRRFLMKELRALAPAAIVLPTQEAEELAAAYLENESVPPPEAKLSRTALAHVWRLPNADRTVVALFREDRLRAELATWLDPLTLPEVRVIVLPPEATSVPAGLVAPQEAGDFLPGWRLGLSFKDGDPLAETAARQARFYLGVGVLVVVVIVLLSWLVARYVAAQMRLARMKDELVSTVSHELKTPLASMRALLDTLSAGRYRDAAQMQRYLHLTTKENLRLSHLIENFLVFSRLARGQQQFQFTALAPGEIVRTALDAVGEKLTSPSCRLTTQLAPELPAIRGDADALATVLVNLLDNAYEYTNGDKQLEVRVYAEGEQVVFAVTDNGIGIAPNEQTRIFERFYQVDQSLTRKRGGCGLGLSIVRSIVEAHHGTVDVESEPGKGSTFRVRIPRATPNA